MAKRLWELGEKPKQTKKNNNKKPPWCTMSNSLHLMVALEHDKLKQVTPQTEGQKIHCKYTINNNCLFIQKQTSKQTQMRCHECV